MDAAGIERTRLHVDGLATPITARVARRRDDAMIVRQALPFLRLDTGVTGDDGTRARIARVAIDMEGDVPSLLLELSHEPDARPAHAPVAALAPGVSARPPRGDATVPYATDTTERRSREVVVGAAPAPTDVVLAPIRLPAPLPLPLHLRVLGALARAWSMIFGRPPALPSGPA